MNEAPRTVREILKASETYMAQHGVEDAMGVARILLGRLLRCKPLDVVTRSDEILREPVLEAMRRGIRRAAAGEPVQYITGETCFMGHPFKTDRRALIPRPETELLVETVLSCQPLWQQPRPSILDLGTGSGCIAISLAKARPDAAYLAMDISADALALARENAMLNGVQKLVTLVPAGAEDILEPESLDAVVANLPYIRSADIPGLPRNVRDHEPRTALDGGPDGLAIIRDCLQDAVCILKPGGFIFLEIGFDQGPAVRELLEVAGFEDPAIMPDLAGRDRIAVARAPAG